MSERGSDEAVDSRVQAMLDGDEDARTALKVFAGIFRAFDDDDSLEGWTDAELASACLRLQDVGFLTVFMDDDGAGYMIHESPEQAEAYRAELAGLAKPPRKYKRRSRKRMK